jgi:shikimate dehydrogenase
LKIKAAVIGQPVSHSLSPAIFRSLATKMKVDLEYKAIEISNEDLEDKIQELKKDHIGLNVTIPHKESIVDFAQEKSAEVNAIGAANVISFQNHNVAAYNTDVQGIKSTWAQNSINLENENIFIIGGGGAARAVACGASQLGAKSVFIFNRNFKRSNLLVKKMSPLFPNTKFSTVAVGGSEKMNGSYKLIVNATPLGMSGFESGEEYFSNIFNRLVPNPQWAFDLIYKPQITTFMKVAAKSGTKTLGGLDMFIHQALATWNLWFGDSHFDGKARNILKQELERLMRA